MDNYFYMIVQKNIEDIHCTTTYLPHPIPLKTDGLSLNIQLEFKCGNNWLTSGRSMN